MAEELSIIASMPDPGLFSFPPTNNPAPLPPVHAPSSVMHPFNIPDNLFVAALDPRVPLTIATAYAVTVKLLNKYNKSTGKKPWGISKTRSFRLFVVLHNIFLAVYSAWTFWGMLGGMRRSIVNPLGPSGLAGTADSFCRLHGAGGLGNSIFYNEATSSWISDAQDPAMAGSLPSAAEPGRMWNEGLAYYGWIFYLSKFYEVLDTFIILAKGKPSSTLQTYHHAGAMMCMWAGMRFMSAPIWMFVLVNSFIHAMMYTYYTITAFSIRVPMVIKRSLTTMQITQFLVGASYAMCHSFVSFIAPILLTKQTTTAVNTPAQSFESALPSASGTFDVIKQFVFGDEEGAAGQLAETASVPSFETKTVYVTQPCVVTTGETFAIWLNVLYLAPLTYLFVSFFIASYVKRSNAAGKVSGKTSRRLSNEVTLAEKAGWDAAKSIEKEVYGGEKMLEGSAVEEDVASKSSPRSKRRA
jgi:hypothetical protein